MQLQNIEQLKQEILDSKLPFSERTIMQEIEDLASRETLQRLDDPNGKYSRAVNSPQNAEAFTQKCLKSMRGDEQTYYYQVLNSAISGELKLLQGLSYERFKEADASSDPKNIFARASALFNVQLLQNITPEVMRKFLFNELYTKIADDYCSCLWRLC